MSARVNAISEVSEVTTSSSSSSVLQDRCVRQYIIPRRIVWRGLSNLDSIHSPGKPGELRKNLVVNALKRFDDMFAVKRSHEQRAAIVNQLELATDSDRVRWNVTPLVEAFAVELNLCERIFFTMDVTDSSTLASLLVSSFLVFTIFLGILLWMIGTITSVCIIPCNGCPPEPQNWMKDLETVCVVIFTLEYLMRLVTVAGVRQELLQPQVLVRLLGDEKHAKKPEATPLPCGTISERMREKQRMRMSRGMTRVLRFVCLPVAICDLLSVLPYWIEFFDTRMDLRMPWLKVFRLFRASRAFKLFPLLNSDIGQLSDMNQLLRSVLVQAFPAFVMTLGLILIALLVFSALVYAVERGDWIPKSLIGDIELVNPPTVPYSTGKFVRTGPGGSLNISPFDSIPDTMWWTLATITTVGYGDVVPVTRLGKVVGTVTILYGAVLLGLPIGIIGSQFNSEFDRVLASNRRRAQLIRERAADAQLRSDAMRRGVTGGSVPASLPHTNSIGSGISNISQNRFILMPARALAFARGHHIPGRRHHGSFTSEHSAVTQLIQSLRECGRKQQQPTTVSEPHAIDVNETHHDVELRENLNSARNNFEDTLREQGFIIGIPLEQQEFWMMELAKTHLCSGPALDRLSIRITIVLLEAEEMKPRFARSFEDVRNAWHRLCCICCQVKSDPMMARVPRTQNTTELCTLD
eukprot:NODE_1414_length_2485_cov_9.554707.p1 GENE.NODE_1414_length_2485_cov_9.554707~~NODE_1414_length_2485_cov_9.554707.p1  ORF type:complete len:711 (-),score=166.38 NODE_1414_length_2485_cov_9.554707:351-2432(-)